MLLIHGDVVVKVHGRRLPDRQLIGVAWQGKQGGAFLRIRIAAVRKRGDKDVSVKKLSRVGIYRLSRRDIIHYLKKDYDMDADRKAVKRNLANLVASGYDLECTEPAADKKPCAKNNQHNTLSALSRDTS